MNAEEQRITTIQQDRIGEWRRRELSSAGDAKWRKALARAHREQETRLQSAIIDTVRSVS